MRAGLVDVGTSLTAGAFAFRELALDTAHLWRSHLPALGSWFCAGLIVHTVGLQASAELGARHAVWAMLAFVVGVVATLVALVLMIHSVEPGLRTLDRLDADATRPAPDHDGAVSEGPAGLQIPRQVFVRESRLDVVATAVGPFLAVYAVWGFVNDEVRALYFSNLTVQGLGGVDDFSIGFGRDRLRFYLAVALVSWVLRQLVAAVLARRRVLPLALAGIVFEALWVFGFFAVAFIIVREVRPWVQSRAGVVGLEDAWAGFLGWLPDWQLPFDLTLPGALDRAVAFVIQTVLPGAWHAVVLPLVWLALTASVLGWREFGSRDVLAGTRVDEQWSGRSRLVGGRLGTVLGLLTADLRTKYLPVLAALRLLGRAGPVFLGVYLLLAAVLTSAQRLFDIAVTVALGPRSVAASLLTDPVSILISGLVFTTLSIALYAAAFDGALAVSTGRNRPSAAAEVNGGTPPPGRPAAPTAANAPGRRTGPG